ncbi:unnamed protein product [Protopolystoma xenopodis]|uniref:ABC transporter domain-containing protein n=1 Tax=Protopolystoma xenopodis TaxID=117903 RepID=A0A3S5AQ82_9PLAT|nr:unnamed protein product [Protopolystoma xenopodis]
MVLYDYPLITSRQDDIVMGALTVRENIAFSAALRLSADIDAKTKHARVNQVLAELGLNAVADVKVMLMLKTRMHYSYRVYWSSVFFELSIVFVTTSKSVI